MSSADVRVPNGRGLYYGGGWQAPVEGRTAAVDSPATGETLATIQEGTAADVPRAVAAARTGFEAWREVPPFERARLLKELARIVRQNARELAWLDAVDTGNPIAEMMPDAMGTAMIIDYFAGLVTEMKGTSVPMGPDTVSFSVREPYGVVVRIAAFNHPLAFAIAKAAAPLAAGNAIIVKPPEQAPLSALRAAELFDGVLPPGVFNVMAGGRELGAALASDPGVSMVALVGSAATGRAVMHAGADTLKRVSLELGGKNALIAFPDSDPEKVAAAMVAGMNYTWCGQSCGSVSRAFVHADIHDAVLACLPAHLSRFQARPSHRSGDHDGQHHRRAAVRARAGLYRNRQGGRGASRLWRRAAGRSRAPQRLLCPADRVRRRDDADAHRPRGDLRTHPGGAALER